MWVFTYNRELCGTLGSFCNLCVNIPKQNFLFKICSMKTAHEDGKVAGVSGDAYDAYDPQDAEDFKPLTAEEVQKLRLQQPLLSIWRVVLAQVVVGLLVAALTWLLTGRVSAAWSAAYGGLSVVIPAALFARGLTSKATTVNSGTAVFGFLLWEMVKIGLTIAMLYAAVWLVKDLSWPAMLVGLVVTMKVYWVVFAWRKVFHPAA